MRSNDDFDIPFEGLKLGKHSFEFEITDKFFANITFSSIERGKVKLTFKLEKKETMMVGDFDFDGFVVKSCDRCTDALDVPVKLKAQLIFKYGEEQSTDENLVVIEPSEYKLRLAPICYELIEVNLPQRNIHPEGKCNKEMLSLIEKYSKVLNDNKDTDCLDPRWEALKKIK